MHIDRIVEHTGQRFVDKIHNFDIEDRYQYMQDELVELLRARFKAVFYSSKNLIE